MRFPVVVVVVLASAIGAAAGPHQTPTALCPGCNIVLLSIDTLRSDHLPCYGYERATAPFLCRLAVGEDGVLFEKVSSPGGGTLPSHMTMLTSLYPEVHGLVSQTRSRRLEEQFVTLAERLADGGYRRAAFTDGGLTSARYGFDQGFEVYSDRGRGLAHILPRARRWLDAEDERPFFLFLHTYEVHSERTGSDLPYAPPEAYRGLFPTADSSFDGCDLDVCGTAFLKAANVRIRRGADPRSIVGDADLARLIALYDGGIRSVDDQLQILIEDLEQRDLLDSTVVVVVSDHGEEFLDHGYFLHTASQYEELTAVPLIMRVPGLGGRGRRVAELASLVDLMPTVLALVGVDPGTHAQGRDLVKLVAGGDAVRSDALLLSSIHTGDWKLFPDRQELYDRRRDRRDRDNVAPAHPEVVSELSRRYQDRLVECRELRSLILGGDSPTEPDAVLDDDVAAELEALGYLDR